MLETFTHLPPPPRPKLEILFLFLFIVYPGGGGHDREREGDGRANDRHQGDGRLPLIIKANKAHQMGTSRIKIRLSTFQEYE